MSSALTTATNFLPSGRSVDDEMADKGLQNVAHALTLAVQQYNGQRVPVSRHYNGLVNGLREGLKVAAATKGPDILSYVLETTQEVNWDVVDTTLLELDNETMVIFVINTEDPASVNMEWLLWLDNSHSKAAQIGVIDAHEDIVTAFASKVDPFVRALAA